MLARYAVVLMQYSLIPGAPSAPPPSPPRTENNGIGISIQSEEFLQRFWERHKIKLTMTISGCAQSTIINNMPQPQWSETRIILGVIDFGPDA
jgi:hypothetical protein